MVRIEIRRNSGPTFGKWPIRRRRGQWSDVSDDDDMGTYLDCGNSSVMRLSVSDKFNITGTCRGMWHFLWREARDVISSTNSGLESISVKAFTNSTNIGTHGMLHVQVNERSA